MITITFAEWKAEYQPRVYEDSGAECFDHEECECEFLYTFEFEELEELQEEEGYKLNQIWTWGRDAIKPGIGAGELLVTEKPWANINMEVK